MPIQGGEGMNTINRDKFFFAIQGPWGDLNNTQRSALESLLTFMEGDANVADPRHAAYMLATSRHETAGTYRPIEEYGKGEGHKYGIPDRNGNTYYGRGFVQLTWADNYKTMGANLSIDLYNN